MRALLIILGSMIVGQVCAQSDSLEYKWLPHHSYKIAEGEVWSVDGLENVYVSKNGLIQKYDSAGVFKFSQSIKSLGRMTQMVPINTMKLVHFSEEQQTVCYFDNTLSPLDDCLELAEEGIMNATMISESSQPDKLWVLDNLNSRLLLLALRGTDQPQELMNLRGILQMDKIIQIRERDSRLYVLDESKGVYVFDLYGTLIEFIPQKDVLQVDANAKTLFTIKDEQLHIRALTTGESFAIDLPVSGVREFAYENRCFFFRTAKNVHKFKLQFSE